MAVIHFVRRNLVTITFPVLAISAIFADWNHTRKWKAARQQLQE